MLKVISILLLLFSSTIQAAGLYDLFIKALDNDPDFAAAKFSYIAGRESRNIGIASLLPTLQANLSVADVSQELVFANSSNISTNRDTVSKTGTISLSQPLFNLQKFKDYKIGDMRAELASAQFAEEQQALILRVSKAYFDFLLAQDTFELASAQKASLAAQYLESKHLFEAGASTITDMEESNARYQVAASQELSAKNSLQMTQAQMEKIVGTLPANLRKSGVYEFEPILPDPNDMEVWRNASKKQNLKVLSAEVSILISELEFEKTYARHYPTLELNASYQTADQLSEVVDKSDTARIGIDLNIPIYQGGLVAAESRRLNNLKEKVISNKLSAEKDSELQAMESYLGVVGGVTRILALKQAVRSGEITLKGMQVGQKNGLRTNTDVLNAEQLLFSAKRDLQKERYEYLGNRLKLKASIGNLTEAEMIFLDNMVQNSTKVVMGTNFEKYIKETKPH